MAGADNKEREQRILNVAADLFMHYGYDKTAVSEIARGAGVSQGTIYLHFKSKEDLLEALILRESRTYAERWINFVQNDPDGGTIAGMYKNSLLAMDASPFMAAIYKKDGRILGNYLRKEDSVLRRQGEQGTRHEFVQLMQDAGAIRKDIDAKVIAHVMSMISYGMVAMQEIMDASQIPPTEDLIEGIALLMDSALTPPDGGNKAAAKAILMQIYDAAAAQFDETYGSNNET